MFKTPCFFPLDSSQGDPPAETLESKLAKAEEESQKSRQVSSTLNRLMADPEIRAVLQAKQNGTAVQIVPRDEYEGLRAKATTPASTEQEQNADLASLDEDQQKLARVILGMTSKAQQDLVKKSLEPYQSTVSELAGQAKKQEADRMRAQVENAQKKYRDFDKVVEHLVPLANELPSLSPDELYLIHKTRTGGQVERISAFESEKGSSQPNRPDLSSTRKAPLPQGQKGFAALLEEASAARSTTGRTIN